MACRVLRLAIGLSCGIGVLLGLAVVQPSESARQGSQPAAILAIDAIADNAGSYPNAQVPKYEELEVTFQVTGSVAQNLQLPYDAAPPPGVPPGVGITVNALFSQDDFRTSLIQPAFYYQD